MDLMSYLLNGGDPYRDVPDGTINGSDLAMADLDAVTGLVLEKNSIELSRVVGSDRIKFLSTSHWTPEIAELARSLSNLKHLQICGIRGALAGTGELAQLKILSVYACPGVVDFEPFKECARLETLWISGCVHLQSLDGIDRLTHLKEFAIEGTMTKTGTITTLSPLSGCRDLNYVSLATRIYDKEIAALQNLPNLRYLWLQNRFKNDQYEAILASCPNLEVIELHNGTYARLTGFAKDED